MNLAPWKDKALFTPGPLTTSRTVKQAMLRDLGSRDAEFIAVVADIRRRLLTIAGADPTTYTTVLMQGSGTFGIESVLGSVIAPGGTLAVLVNGAYGERMKSMAATLRIPCVALQSAEDRPNDAGRLDELLAHDESITHVAAVHCETTTGIINPIAEIGAIAGRHNRILIVDAMSSFGAYPIELAEWGIDFLVSSANKCVEGVPGFSFVIARTAALLATRGYARSLSLNLLAQYEGMAKDGQFRFTPPVHAILAFHQALVELEEEGGVAARAVRYYRNYVATRDGLAALGFETYLRAEDQGYTITSFRYPTHAAFDFQAFYQGLSERGHVIYPGKLTHADCFRIGHIGRLDEADVRALISAVAEVLAAMGIPSLAQQEGSAV
jgi:2-aminoethylphosphonate-pyruvate transaminase